MDKHHPIFVVLILLPALSVAKVPFYFFSQPASAFQGGPLISHAPLGAFQYNTYQNLSHLYPEPQIQTECQHGSYCTVDSFCTVNVTISPVALNLTEEEKDERGELIPCWHPESESIQVCCNVQQGEEPVSEELNDALQCPRIPKAFSESSCSDVASTCGNVGYSDPKCQNNELCCFDGCANRCISDLSPEPEEASTASETISNFLSSSHGGGSYSSLPYRQYPLSYYPHYQHYSTYSNPVSYQPAPQVEQRPFTALFPQSPSYSFSTSGKKQNSEEPAPSTTASPPRPTPVSASFSPSPRPTFTHSYSNQQSFGYVRPLAHSTVLPKTHEALTAFSPSAPVYAQEFSPSPEPSQRPSYEYYEQHPYAPYRAATEGVQYSGFQVSAPSSSNSEVCPSAMKCIPKKNCDFNGVIVSHVVSTSPEFDVVRVPLLPCSTIQTEDAYVCCRDPHHVDIYSQY